jgi:hypothetical protein
LGDNVEPLEQRECCRDVGYRPLHQLALLQALKESVHRALVVLLAPRALHRQEIMPDGSKLEGWALSRPIISVSFLN